MSDESRLIERLWFGDRLAERIARAALTPLELTYRAVVSARAALYDAGIAPAKTTVIPALSVGNLTVGGTGKTPVAAWLAARLRERGAHPAIVLRGYGDDEPLVHRILNPDVPVLVGADRVEGVQRALAAGCDVAVLDDAFQHRRARRIADVVLVSADRWTGEVRLLPAGPFREPLIALRRASLVIVTAKAADAARVDAVCRALAGSNPELPLAVVRLSPSELRQVGAEETRALSALRGQRVAVATAIGDPSAFLAQLTSLGAEVDATTYPDHHAFTDEQIAALARSSASGRIAVCTLKDAVKVAPRWPRAAGPLWYVSQRVDVEQGMAAIESILQRVLNARSAP